MRLIPCLSLLLAAAVLIPTSAQVALPGTSAIVRTAFEKGRGFVFSPYLEMSNGLGCMLARAVTWVTKRDAPSEPNSPRTDSAANRINRL